MTLTSQQIYDALLRDPSFNSQITNDALRAVWRDLCEIVPETLSNFLDQPVGIASILNAKVAFLKKFAEGDWLKRMADAQPDEGFDFSFASEVFKEMLSGMLEAIPGIVGDVPAFLAENGIDEETYLGHPKAGRFTEATMTRWKQGNFTIADLLASQPGSIIQND